MYEQRERPEPEPGGCREVFVLTRAALGIIFWPMIALFAAMVYLAVSLYLFVTNPLLVLIPIAILVAAGLAFARWENKRFRPPGL